MNVFPHPGLRDALIAAGEAVDRAQLVGDIVGFAVDAGHATGQEPPCGMTNGTVMEREGA